MRRSKKIIARFIAFVMAFSLVQMPLLSKPLPAFAGNVQTISGEYVWKFSNEEYASAVDVSDYYSEYGNPHKVNESSYFYYEQLNEVEKVMYLLMEKCDFDTPYFYIKNYNQFASEDDIFDMAENAISALQYDQPMTRLMWAMWRVDVQVAYAESQNAAKITLFRDPLATDYNIQKTNAIIDNIVAAAPTGKDRYTTLMNVSLYMAGTRDYNEYSSGAGAVDMSTDYIDSLDQSPIGVFAYEYAVCNSYSYACKILCDRFNIPCVSVLNYGHAWNFILMEDGKWYSIDWTYADKWFENMAEFNSYGKNYLIKKSLIGSGDKYYTSDYRYDTNYRIGGGKDAIVPELSTTSYSYEGAYEYSYGDVVTYEEPVGKFLYTVNDDNTTCTITGYEGLQAGDLIVPETIDGYTVNKIGDSAFYRATGFTGELVVPDSVLWIEDGAFLECNKLSSLKLSDNLKTIGRVTFAGCSSLGGTLYLPDSLEELLVKNSESLTCGLPLNNFETIEYKCDNAIAKAVCDSLYENQVSLIHTWDDGVVTVEPTATQTGTMHYSCTMCDATRDEEIPKLSDVVVDYYNDDKPDNLRMVINRIETPGLTDVVITELCETYSIGAYDEGGNLLEPESFVNISIARDGKANVYRVVDGKLVDMLATYEDGYVTFTTNFYGTFVIVDEELDSTPSYKFSNRDGLAKGTDGNWYYYEEGELVETKTGLVTNNAGIWYVENGQINFNKSGVIESDGKEYVVKYGYMSIGYYGLTKKPDGTWAYAEAGELTYAYTGLAKNEDNNTWWYITDGVIDFRYTGIGSNDTGDYRVVNGQIDFTYNGWFNAKGLWWYMKGGMVDTAKEGLVKKDNSYYYVKNGEIDFKFTGLAENAGNTYYVKYGYLDFSFSGDVVIDGVKYTVKNGIVQ